MENWVIIIMNQTKPKHTWVIEQPSCDETNKKTQIKWWLLLKIARRSIIFYDVWWQISRFHSIGKSSDSFFISLASNRDFYSLSKRRGWWTIDYLSKSKNRKLLFQRKTDGMEEEWKRNEKNRRKKKVGTKLKRLMDTWWKSYNVQQTARSINRATHTHRDYGDSIITSLEWMIYYTM